MKHTLAALAFLVALPASHSVARTPRPVFRVDSLNVSLRAKYRSAYRAAALKRSIRAKILKMKRCFIAVVKKHPKYSGFLWLAVTFNRRGKVTQKTITTTVKNPVAAKCMEWMVNFWKLPRGAVGKANAQIRISTR